TQLRTNATRHSISSPPTPGSIHGACTRWLRFFISSKRRHTRFKCDWSSDVCSSDLRMANSAVAIPTAEVQRKDFVDTLEIKGEVKALHSKVIAAPYGAGDLQIVSLVANSAKVKKGDLLVQFDATTMKQKLAQDQSGVKSAEAEINQSQAAARLKEEQDVTDVMKAKYEAEK